MRNEKGQFIKEYIPNNLFKKGYIPWNKGKKGLLVAWNKGLKGYNVGEKSGKWIKDRTLIKRQEERNSPNDKQWKYAVYKRDDFKCRIANENCDGRIEAHHILSWRDYPELRFIINNGITLCHFHHPRKRIEEANLSPYFQELVKNIK